MSGEREGRTERGRDRGILKHLGNCTQQCDWKVEYCEGVGEKL